MVCEYNWILNRREWKTVIKVDAEGGGGEFHHYLSDCRMSSGGGGGGCNCVYFLNR